MSEQGSAAATMTRITEPGPHNREEGRGRYRLEQMWSRKRDDKLQSMVVAPWRQFLTGDMEGLWLHVMQSCALRCCLLFV